MRRNDVPPITKRLFTERIQPLFARSPLHLDYLPGMRIQNILEAMLQPKASDRISPREALYMLKGMIPTTKAEEQLLFVDRHLSEGAYRKNIFLHCVCTTPSESFSGAKLRHRRRKMVDRIYEMCTQYWVYKFGLLDRVNIIIYLTSLAFVDAYLWTHYEDRATSIASFLPDAAFIMTLRVLAEAEDYHMTQLLELLSPKFLMHKSKLKALTFDILEATRYRTRFPTGLCQATTVRDWCTKEEAKHMYLVTRDIPVRPHCGLVPSLAHNSL